MLELFSLILLFSLYNSEALIRISDLFGSNEKDDYIFLKYYKNPENEIKEFIVLKELKILFDISVSLTLSLCSPGICKAKKSSVIYNNFLIFF